jgi:hypothetical protein
LRNVLKSQPSITALTSCSRNISVCLQFLSKLFLLKFSFSISLYPPPFLHFAFRSRLRASIAFSFPLACSSFPPALPFCIPFPTLSELTSRRRILLSTPIQNAYRPCSTRDSPVHPPSHPPMHPPPSRRASLPPLPRHVQTTRAQESTGLPLRLTAQHARSVEVLIDSNPRYCRDTVNASLARRA